MFALICTKYAVILVVLQVQSNVDNDILISRDNTGKKISDVCVMLKINSAETKEIIFKNIIT